MHIDEFLERLESRVYDSAEVDELVRDAWMAGMQHARSLVMTQKLRFDSILDQQAAKAEEIKSELQDDDSVFGDQSQ